MKLIFYIFLICQICNYLYAFAEKLEDDSSRLNSVKWEKVEGDNSNSLKKIFWESLKDDDDNFEEDYKENVSIEKNKKSFDENKLLKFGGLTVDNAILPKWGESNINMDYDFLGNLFGSYSYSLSNIFQLNLISAGSFKTKNSVISKSSVMTSTYLGENNFNYRFGGKFLLFSPEKNDLIWLSSRVSLGEELDSRQGYIYTELTTTVKLNNWLAINISPKYIFSGVENLGALGFANNINLSNNLQFIAETNLGITKGSKDNSTFALRYAYSPTNSIDVFVTNSVGFQDIGTMLSLKDYKFGMRMNYIF